MTSLFNFAKKPLPALLVIFSLFFIASSCDKLKKKPILKISAYEMTADGSLKIRGQILEGKKNVTNVGFCFGTSSSPVADIYSSSMINTVQATIDGDNFSATIPGTYFESYTAYYFRAYAEGDELIYSAELYLDQMQQEAVTPSCNPSDNFIDIGGFSGAETFTVIDMPEPGYYNYEIHANSNSHIFTFEFYTKPKTGIYTTTGEADDFGEISIYFYTGSISGAASSGSTVYVNEVEKDKFEITFCAIPWKLNNTTFEMTGKLVCP